MTAKFNIRTMPSGRPVGKEKFARPVSTALPQPDRSKYIYIVADDYIAAIEYAQRHNLWPGTTRYVSCAATLQGIEAPQVIVVNSKLPVPEAIAEALIRHRAHVTYATD